MMQEIMIPVSQGRALEGILHTKGKPFAEGSVLSLLVGEASCSFLKGMTARNSSEEWQYPECRHW